MMYDSSKAGFLEHRIFISKGWGWEDHIWNNEKYCCKKLFVKRGKCCSWHYHKLKDETFHIDSGEITLFYGDTDDMKQASRVVLRAGCVFHIPPGLRHRFYGNLDSLITEASTQHYDEDSIRIEKGD